MNSFDPTSLKGWTLFLDRDGVINQRIVGGYVTRWEEFSLFPGLPDAIRTFTNLFSRIIIVTNQQGIGKGIMTEEELEAIHSRFVKTMEEAGGRIDAIYYAPFLESEGSIQRKPGVGMALRARKAFPEIRFNQSVMAGDSLSDMRFGRRLGMKTVFISTDPLLIRKGASLIDRVFPDLISFARFLQSSQ